MSHLKKRIRRWRHASTSEIAPFHVERIAMERKNYAYDHREARITRGHSGTWADKCLAPGALDRASFDSTARRQALRTFLPARLRITLPTPNLPEWW